MSVRGKTICSTDLPATTLLSTHTQRPKYIVEDSNNLPFISVSLFYISK